MLGRDGDIGQELRDCAAAARKFLEPLLAALGSSPEAMAVPEDWIAKGFDNDVLLLVKEFLSRADECVAGKEAKQKVSGNAAHEKLAKSAADSLKRLSNPDTHPQEYMEQMISTTRKDSNSAFYSKISEKLKQAMHDRCGGNPDHSNRDPIYTALEKGLKESQAVLTTYAILAILQNPVAKLNDQKGKTFRKDLKALLAQPDVSLSQGVKDKALHVIWVRLYILLIMRRIHIQCI